MARDLSDLQDKLECSEGTPCWEGASPSRVPATLWNVLGLEHLWPPLNWRKGREKEEEMKRRDSEGEEEGGM